MLRSIVRALLALMLSFSLVLQSIDAAAVAPQPASRGNPEASPVLPQRVPVAAPCGTGYQANSRSLALHRQIMCLGATDSGAGFQSPSRGFQVRRVLAERDAPGATVKGYHYQGSKYGQESVAQARVIAQLDPTYAPGSVNPGLQWETLVPVPANTSGAGRIDVLRYNPDDSSPVYVAEVKGEWLDRVGPATAQVENYRKGLESVYSSREVVLAPADPAYIDTFSMERTCKAKDGTRHKVKVDYVTTMPTDGVYYVTRSQPPCEPVQEPTDREEEEEGLEELAFGRDADGNGMDDALDLALAARPEYRGRVSPQVRSHEVDIEFPREDDHFLRRILEAAAADDSRLLDALLRALMDMIEHAARRVASGKNEDGPHGGALKPVALPVRPSFCSLTQQQLALAAMAIGGGAYLVKAGTPLMVAVTSNGATVLLSTAVVGTAMIVAVGAVAVGIGVAYAWQSCAGSWGDPHLVTHDGLGYDLQAAGEFTTVRTSDLEVQERYQALGPWVSVLRALAIGYAGDRIEVSLDGLTSRVLVNGVEVDLENGHVTPGGVPIVRYRDSVLGEQVLVSTPQALISVGAGRSSVRMAVGVRSVGLLGDNDGDATNDLRSSSGVAVSPDDEAGLHGWYADSWRVTESSSLFTYPAGKTTASFTDRSFPSHVKRLSDFTAAELDAASDTCSGAGVEPGVTMEACILDLLVTADATFAEAAAAAPGGTDPTLATFSPDGSLTQTFDGMVGRNMAGPSYVHVDAASRAVGPLTETGASKSYGFVVASVPRHDTVTLTTRLLVLGEAREDVTRSVEIAVDEAETARVSLEGDGGVTSGAGRITVERLGEGRLLSGLAYQAFAVSLAAKHSGDTLRGEIRPRGFHPVLQTALAIDTVELSLTAPPADVASGLTVPFTAGSEQGAGSGAIETAGGADEYRFTLAETTDVLVETSRVRPLEARVRAEVVDLATGQRVTPTDRDLHLLYRALPAGEYSLVVTGRGGPVATYALPVLVGPPPQEFPYELGQSVSDGKIGDAAVAGAGNLETTASLDVYRFTVDEATAGTWVLESGGVMPVCREARLVSDATGETLGRPCTTTGTRLEVDLALGAYRIEVPVWLGSVGGYAFTSYRKEGAQEFAYTLGQRVDDQTVGGVAAPGAGNLETPASVDVYRFTVPESQAGQTWVFSRQPVMTACREAQLFPDAADAKPLGHVCLPGNNPEFTLPAGSYRIVVPTFNSRTGSYAFETMRKGVDVFSYEPGQTITDGTVGGAPAPGAGRIENAAAMDVYRFTVPADRAGQTLVFAGQSSVFSACESARLLPGQTGGTSLGSPCRYGGASFQLQAGEYRIEVPVGTWGPGGYTLSSFWKPAPQEFSWALGDEIRDGSIGGRPAPGAGNLETSASMDVYRFTVSPEQAGKAWTFRGAGGLWAPCRDARLYEGWSGGRSLGGPCGIEAWTTQLAPGDYRIEVPAGANGSGTYTLTATPAAVTGTRPTISGQPLAGQTLIATAGTWGPGDVEHAWQWLRDGSPIPGATSSTYQVAVADRGTRLSVQLTGMKAGYSSTVRVSDRTSTVMVPGAVTVVGPARVLTTQTLEPGAQTTVTVTGRRGVPYRDVGAVWLTATVAAGSEPGTLVVHGTGQPPEGPTLTVAGGATATSTVLVPIDPDQGTVTIRNTSSGRLQVALDVHGWQRPEQATLPGAIQVVPQTPVLPPTSTAAEADRTLRLPDGTVPAGTGHALLQVTVTSTAAGDAVLHGDDPASGTSLRFPAGTVTMLAIAPVRADGTLTLRTSAAATVAVDVVGHVRGGAAESGAVLRTVTAAPTTRSLPAGQAVTMPADGAAPAGASAVIVQVTTGASTQAGGLTTWGTGTTNPGTCDLSFAAGEQTTQTILVPLAADGTWKVRATAAVEVTTKIVGYMA